MTTVDRTIRPERPVPPLESGDRLTRAEFLRRWEAMPALQRAELIDGVVFMPSPLRTRQHGGPHAQLGGLLAYYAAHTPGSLTATAATTCLDEADVPQPDLCLWLPAHAGGKAHIDADGYLVGPPDLVGEIAASSVSHDLHGKLHVYRRHGVREYVVWRTLDGVLDIFALRDGRFEPVPRAVPDVWRSAVLPGLWLDVDALLRDDLPAAYELLRQGMATPEHAALLARLRPPLA